MARVWDQQLKDDAKTFKQADARAMESLRSAMPIGRHVTWMHGRHERMGEVQDILGHSFHHAKIRVKSIVSGKIMDVCAFAVISRLK